MSQKRFFKVLPLILVIAVSFVLAGSETADTSDSADASEPIAACASALTLGCEAMSNSTLVRNENGVTWMMNSDGRKGSSAYTLWVIAFYEPDGCVGSCGLDDLLADRTSLFLLWLSRTPGNHCLELRIRVHARRVGPGQEQIDREGLLGLKRFLWPVRYHSSAARRYCA